MQNQPQASLKQYNQLNRPIQSQEINSDQYIKVLQELKMNKMSVSKKFSINTASSNKDLGEEQVNKSAKHTEDQLKMSSIQLLEQVNNCKIGQKKGIYPTSFALISIPKRKQNITLKQLMEFNFSVLSYPLRDLISFTTQIIYTNDYAKSIYGKSQIEELVLAIAGNYNKVSYHNYSHAFSLMQLHFQCLQIMPSFKSHFTSEEIFYTMISAISHDLNHNGTNNIFEVKRGTDLALLHNNESVLENMHISMLWKILKQNPSLDFLSLSKDHKHGKQIITKLILSTDMSSHFKNLQLLQKRRKENDIDMNNFEDRMFMMEQVFHSCDLGNPTLEYNSYISWAALLSHQFNEQVKMEKIYEVEVTKSFEYKNFITLYNDQVWFVGKIVYPLWKELCLYLPDLSVLMKRIEHNIAKLTQKLTEQQLKART